MALSNEQWGMMSEDQRKVYNAQQQMTLQGNPFIQAAKEQNNPQAAQSFASVTNAVNAA